MLVNYNTKSLKNFPLLRTTQLTCVTWLPPFDSRGLAVCVYFVLCDQMTKCNDPRITQGGAGPSFALLINATHSPEEIPSCSPHALFALRTKIIIPKPKMCLLTVLTHRFISQSSF